MTEIIVSIVSALAVIIGAVLTFIIQMKKLRQDNENLQTKKNEELTNHFNASLNESKELYLEKISNLNGIVSDMKASDQQFQAIMELRLEHMTNEFNDMKIEVREHNNFARRLPVLEEQMKVTNNRLKDLENKQ